MQNTLLIIDPQNDFHSGGSLAVPGADADALRLSAWIDRESEKLHSIVVTLDTHHKLHIAHAAFWQAGNDPSARPAVFSHITSRDIEEGKWVPRNAALTRYCIE